jgi:hypothetical protein
MIDILQLKRVIRGVDSDNDAVRDHLASAIEPQIIDAARAGLDRITIPIDELERDGHSGEYWMATYILEQLGYIVIVHYDNGLAKKVTIKW